MTLFFFSIGLVCTTAILMYLSGRQTRKLLAAQRDESRAEVRRLEGLLTAKSVHEARILVELDADNRRLETEKNHLKMQIACLQLDPTRLAGLQLKIRELAAEHLITEMPHFAQAWQRALRHAEATVHEEAEGRTPPLLLLRSLGGKIRDVFGLRYRTCQLTEVKSLDAAS